MANAGKVLIFDIKQIVARVKSVDSHLCIKGLIWSCSTSFVLDLCLLSIFDQCDFNLVLYLPLEASKIKIILCISSINGNFCI